MFILKVYLSKIKIIIRSERNIVFKIRIVFYLFKYYIFSLKFKMMMIYIFIK